MAQAKDICYITHLIPHHNQPFVTTSVTKPAQYISATDIQTLLTAQMLTVCTGCVGAWLQLQAVKGTTALP